MGSEADVRVVRAADTQLKKLVYLYLINYAKSNPDLTILAVNTFVKVRSIAAAATGYHSD